MTTGFQSPLDEKRGSRQGAIIEDFGPIVEMGVRQERQLQAGKTRGRRPPNPETEAVARRLGELSASHRAFQVAASLAAKTYPGPTLFWYPAMRATLDDPGLPELAEQLGLMTTWKATGTNPDVCSEAAPPAFCGMI